MKPFIVLLIATFLIAATSRVSVEGNDSEKIVNILIMVPWPDARNLSVTGWDAGLALLTAGRVAVKEVNERDSILKGYRLNVIVAPHEPCAFTESMESLANLVRNAIYPNSRVAAILGLYCSTSTVFLSQIAGSSSIDMLQLSASNSPVFTVESYRFPRLVRFLQSAAVFSNTVYKLMDKYDWQRIGLVQDLKSVFYVGMAQSFVRILHEDKTGKTLSYHGGLVETNFVNETLQEIREAKVRIIYLTATETQIVALACGAYQAGMVYPNYTWIIADYRIEHLTKLNGTVRNCDVYKALQNSVMMYLVLQSDDPMLIIESSNITYQTYSDEYEQELIQVGKDYAWLLNETGDKLIGDKEYGGVLYDQVWAFAIALQNALPILESKGLDIEQYGFGQSDITDILEESLLNVSFRGASGYISFTDEREVGSLVEVYQTVTNDSKFNMIGECEIINKGTKDFSCDQVNLNRTNFDDQIESVTVTFPTVWGVAIIFIILLTMAVITFILVLLIYYREEPEVKATSPFLSVIMFCGCYLLCIAAILHTIGVTFGMSDIVFALVCNAELLLGVNGCNLLFVTLFIKLFRIAQIFNNQNLVSLGWVYTNRSLMVIALTLSILPDIILVIMFSYDPIVRQTNVIYRVGPNLLQNDVYSYCVSSKLPLLWLCLVFGYLSIFIACIVYLAVSTRNIQNENFKDTKKVNAFIFFTILAFGIPIPCSILMLYASGSYFIGNFIIVFGFLLLASLSQVMLFMPKVIPRLLGFPIKSTSRRKRTWRSKSAWKQSNFVKSFIRNPSFVL